MKQSVNGTYFHAVITPEEEITPHVSMPSVRASTEILASLQSVNIAVKQRFPSWRCSLVRFCLASYVARIEISSLGPAAGHSRQVPGEFGAPRRPPKRFARVNEARNAPWMKKLEDARGGRAERNQEWNGTTGEPEGGTSRWCPPGIYSGGLCLLGNRPSKPNVSRA